MNGEIFATGEDSLQQEGVEEGAERAYVCAGWTGPETVEAGQQSRGKCLQESPGPGFSQS